MKKTKDEIFIFVLLFLCLSTIFLIIFYFYFDQELNDFYTTLGQLSLTDWRSVAHIGYGALGLILGYWYFIRKVKLEDTNSKKDRARKRFSYLYEEYCRGDELVNEILDLEVLNENDLKKKRNQIDRLFLSINNYLDCNDSLLGFSSDELESLLAVHSFINSSEIIFEMKFDNLQKSDTANEYDKYCDVIQDARTICLQKEESL